MQAHKNMCLHTYTWDSLHFFLAFKVWCFRIFYIATYTSTSFIRLCNCPVHGCYWCWYGLVLSWYRRSCKLLAVVEDGGPRLRDESQLKPCLSFLIGQWDKNKQPAAPPPWILTCLAHYKADMRSFLLLPTASLPHFVSAMGKLIRWLCYGWTARVWFQAFNFTVLRSYYSSNWVIDPSRLYPRAQEEQTVVISTWLPTLVPL